MMAKLIWIGDSDPEAQSVTIGGVTFVKGHATEVKDKDLAAKLATNPMFSGDAKVDLPDADEPTEEEQMAAAEAGTEKAALKRTLRDSYGIAVQGNPSVDTLRTKLVEASAA